MSVNSRPRLRHSGAILFSVILVARAGISLVAFAGGSDGEINPNAHATLVVVAALGTCVALGALILAASRWSAARSARWRVLGALWLMCFALMLLEWTVGLASSG